MTDTPTPAEQQAIDAMLAADDAYWHGSHRHSPEGHKLAMYRAIPGSSHARSAIDKGALDQIDLGASAQAAKYYRLASEDETDE